MAVMSVSLPGAGLGEPIIGWNDAYRRSWRNTAKRIGFRLIGYLATLRTARARPRAHKKINMIYI